MRIVAVITEPAVITRILAHRVRARDPTPRLRGPLSYRYEFRAVDGLVF